MMRKQVWTSREDKSKTVDTTDLLLSMGKSAMVGMVAVVEEVPPFNKKEPITDC